MSLYLFVMGSGFENFRREENFKTTFHWAGKVGALLQFLFCALACANCKCAYTCGSEFVVVAKSYNLCLVIICANVFKPLTLNFFFDNHRI